MVGGVNVNRTSCCACRSTCENDETCESKMPRTTAILMAVAGFCSQTMGLDLDRLGLGPNWELGVLSTESRVAFEVGPVRIGSPFLGLCAGRAVQGFKFRTALHISRTVCTVIPTIRHIWREEEIFWPSRRMDSQCKSQFVGESIKKNLEKKESSAAHSLPLLLHCIAELSVKFSIYSMESSSHVRWKLSSAAMQKITQISS